VLAALAEGETALRGALWSEDTEIMVDALRVLGFNVAVEPDTVEASNCTITVKGLGGRIPNAGTAREPLDIYVGNAGTAARFLMAMLCLGDGVYRVAGVSRMHERPQGALFEALRQLGYRIEAQDGRLPAVLYGEGRATNGACTVSIEESSQFASALLLSSRIGGWQVTVTGEDAEESAYVAMTSKMLDVFPERGGEFQIEPDCSSASYFLAAGALLPETRLEVANWPESGWQIDARFADFARGIDLNREQSPVSLFGEATSRAGVTSATATMATLSRISDLGDAIMTAVVLAPFLDQPTRFTDLGRLRLQESERVEALRTELTKCGATVVEEVDSLTVYPSVLHGAEIETYDDHRLAMCFSILGLRVPGMRIRNPACVKKTFPDFFLKLAAARPDGLGATILDWSGGRPLQRDGLLP
jgi:3-phosphoshikimate 1-carboxyvinyltransferase